VAVDPLFDGLVSLRFEDNDAPGQLGAAVSALQARIAELNNTPGVQLGQQIFGSVEMGVKETIGVLDQLKVALAEMRTQGRALSADPSQFGPEITQMREMVAGTEQVIAATNRLLVVQREQQLTAVQTAKVQREALASAVPVAGRPSGDAQLAALGLQMGPGGYAIPIPGASGGGGLSSQADVRTQIAATTSVGEGTALEQAQANLLTARTRLVVSIDNEALVGDKRTAALSAGISGVIAADRKLMVAEEAAAAAAEKAAAVPRVVPNLSEVDPNASAKVQQLELNLAINVAKEKQLLADRTAAMAAGKSAITEVELAQARINTLAVQERLTAALETQASGGSGGGMFGGGMGGLQMLKYYAFYQVFQEGSKLLTQVKTATEEYSLAVNQLSIALGGNQEQAQTLAATYSTMGQNLATAPTIAVDAATKYTRFFRDTSGVSGDIGATLGSNINLLEGAKASGAFGDPAARAAANDKTLGELGAIAQNYSLAAQGASNLYDAATVIAQHYGQQLGGSLLGGTAQIADLLQQSGFSPEQGLALTGSVMQYTGNTSEMAAGDLKRFLGRQGSATFKDVFAEFQVNQNQSLHDELVQLGTKFQTLSETQRASVITSLGGGRAGAAVVAAITDLPDQSQIAAAGAAAIGVAAEQAQARLGTFAGMLEQISADWSTLAKDLGTSGLGSVFGDALALVDPLLRGVDALVSGFALLPGYVKQFLELLALASVAGRVAGGSFGLEGVTGVLTKVGNIGGGAAEVVSADATAARVAALGLDATATEADTAAIGLNTVAAGENAVAQGAAAGAADVGTASLVARLGSLAAAAAAAAGPIAVIAAAIGGVAVLGESWKSYGQSKDGIQLAQDAFAAHANAQTPADYAAAADLANQSIAGLQAARDGIGGGLLYGLGSGTKLGMYPGAPDASTGLNKQSDDLQARLTAQAQQDYLSSLTPAQQNQQNLRNFSLTNTGGSPQWLSVPGVTSNLSPAQQGFGLDYTSVDRGVRNLATLHASVATSMAQLRDELAHIPDSSLADLLTPQSGFKGAGDEIKRLTTQIGHSNNPIQNEADLGLISSYTAELAKRTAGTDQQDAGAAMYDTALKAYHQAVLGNVKAKVDSIHAMQSDNASSQAQIRGTVTAALTEFARTGDVNSVIALLAGVDKAFIATFNANIAAEKRVLADQAATLMSALAALDQAQVDSLASAGLLAGERGVVTTNTPGSAAQTSDAAKLKAARDKLVRDTTIQGTMAAAAPLTAPGGADFTWPKSAAGSGPTAAQIEEARLAAQAIPGDPMSAAIANLRVAQYKMSEPKNQVEYWTALKALHEAQYAYSMAQQSAANDATQLREDLTNPLVVAREKVAEAQRQLALDLSRGALPDVTNKDRLALKQAQSAAEKSAFDQQFSDQSTNYNLQRESLSAYLSYLNAQHTYLMSVHSKTRQQVDELNQVDQALQGLANQLQGQFNLGQIKVPTPYEARAIGAGGLTTNVQITINGTDIPAVKAILTQYLGQGVMSTAGSSARKV